MEVIKQHQITHVYRCGDEERTFTLLVILLVEATIAAALVGPLDGRFGYEQFLLVAPQLLVLVVCAWIGAALTYQRIEFDPVARRLRDEVPVWPGVYLAVSSRPLSWIAGPDLRRRVRRSGVSWDLVLVGTDGDTHDVGTASCELEGRAVIADLRHVLPVREVAPTRSERRTAPALDLREVVFVEVAVRGNVGQCQICGTDARMPWVRCDACETPHHRDCWSYNGGCSTYGCNTRKAAALVTT